MFILVTQAFGRETEYRRAVFAILSFWAWYKEERGKNTTLVFTDNPEWFRPWLKDIPVEFILLTPQKIKEMRGEIDFLHRMKIALIEETFDRYPDGNILYIDSDTFFYNDAGPLLTLLYSDKHLMHKKEYEFQKLESAIDGTPSKNWYQAVFSGFTQDGMVLNNLYSFNAGVLGLPATRVEILPEVYALTDKFYPLSKSHAAEQYAFSIVLQRNNAIYTAEEYIYHYWEAVKKNIVDEYLLLFFGKPVSAKSLLEKVRDATGNLPSEINRHYHWICHRARIFFYEKQTLKGILWSVKAFLKRPFSSAKIIKDALYFAKKAYF